MRHSGTFDRYIFLSIYRSQWRKAFRVIKNKKENSIEIQIKGIIGIPATSKFSSGVESGVEL